MLLHSVLAASEHRYLSSPSNTMPNSPDNDRGCAVRLDGNLKDASEIEWDYDPDGTVPIPADFTMATPFSTAPSKIHPFFTGQAPPAIKLAGARRSTRIIRPSARAVDPDNMMNAPSKRKASGPASKRRVTRKTVAESQTRSEGENDDEIHSEPVGDTTDAEENEAEGPEAGEYGNLKAMADADHQVNIYSTIHSVILMTNQWTGDPL